MTEPSRRVKPGTYRQSAAAASKEAFALDVLLIADEPRASAGGRNVDPTRRAASTGRIESIEPLSMEAVIRRLIAALSEESEP